MARSGAHISVIQFGEAGISVLRVRPTASGLHIVSCVSERRAGRVTDTSAAERLSAFMRKNGLGADRVCTIIPRHQVTVRMLELPSQDRDEIAGMVGLRAEEIVPYPVSELVIDHCVVSRSSPGHSKVLVAVARNDVILGHLDVFEQAGVPVEHAFLSTACLQSAIASVHPPDDELVALAHLGADGIEVLLSCGAQIEFGRGVALSVPLDEAGGISARTLGDLTTELKKSAAAYKREAVSEISEIAWELSSDGAGAASVATALSRELPGGCRPASRFLERVTVGRKHVEVSVPLAAMGAALCMQGRGANEVDLLPESCRARRARTRTRNALVRMAAAALMLAIALGGAYAQALVQRNHYIDELEERAEELRPYAHSVRTKREHLRRVQQQVERTGTALETLSAIAELAPREGLNINRFSFRYGESLTLQGRAREPGYFDLMLDDMRAAGRLSLPQLAAAHEVYRTVTRERNQEVWGFSISVPFPKTGEVAARD